MKEDKKKKSVDWLRKRFRLVVLNDETFEERFSFKLTMGGLIILIGATTMVMTFLVISLVAFTSLREYIPGYGDVNMRRQLISLSVKVDSLENSQQAKDWYIQNLGNVLNGKLETQSGKQIKDTSINYKDINIRPSYQDSMMRNEIERQDKFTLNLSDKPKSMQSISSFFFFSPVAGRVTNSFNLTQAHYGVDIVGKENEIIKSTLDGTVVFSGWSSTDGYVIQVQHSNNLMSIYKHNSDLTKAVGDYVKAGEPIAIIGNSGEVSFGMHLHFELWYNGNPINPQDYIVF